MRPTPAATPTSSATQSSATAPPRHGVSRQDRPRYRPAAPKSPLQGCSSSSTAALSAGSSAPTAISGSSSAMTCPATTASPLRPKAPSRWARGVTGAVRTTAGWSTQGGWSSTLSDVSRRKANRQRAIWHTRNRSGSCWPEPIPTTTRPCVHTASTATSCPTAQAAVSGAGTPIFC